MWSRDEDCVATDTIHVDTRTRLDVVQMNVAVLCDDVDHVVFVTNLETKQVNAKWICSWTDTKILKYS